MIDRLRALYHTPIRDEQRKPLFVVAALVVIFAGVGFALAAEGGRDQPAEPQPAATTPPPAPEPEPVPAPPQDEDLADIPVPSEEERVDEEDAPTRAQIAAAKTNAEDFLQRYLAWTYGRGDTSNLEGATDELLEQLQANRPRPPRDAERRDAEIQTLTLEGASNRAMNMLAVVDDSKSVYTVSLTTARDSDDEWVVTKVGP